MVSVFRAPLLLVLALILATLGAALILRARHAPVDWTGRDTVTITLTKGGFEPENVYISRGTEVAFVTERKSDFWPASDLHPYHQIYADFDPKKAISPDDRWSFTFNKDGRWGYHDHIDTISMGSIIVVPPGERGSDRYNELSVCDQEDIENRRTCWKLHINDALQENIGAALDAMRRIHESDPDFAQSCHVFAHDLGLLTYRTYGEKIRTNSKMVACGHGFWHGYMEAYMKKHEGDVAAGQRFCETIDDGADPQIRNSVLQCYHGIGHGKMEYTLNVRQDLLIDMKGLVIAGVADCGSLGTEDDRLRCSSGVYNVLKDWLNIQGLESRYVSLDDPYALCGYIDDAWSTRGCLLEFSNEAMYLADKNPDVGFPAIVRGASRIDPEYTGTLITYVAQQLGSVQLSRTNQELIDTCQSMLRGEYYRPCIEGITAGVLYNGKPGNEYDRAIEFCVSPSMPYAESCTFLTIRHMQNGYGEAGKRAACEALSKYGLTHVECAESTDV